MALPIPLSALQRYVPTLCLLFRITYKFPVNRTSLSLPLSNSLVQLTVGTGLPSAEQLKVIIVGSPSTTTWSGLKPLKLGGTAKEVTHQLKETTPQRDFKAKFIYLYISFPDCWQGNFKFWLDAKFQIVMSKRLTSLKKVKWSFNFKFKHISSEMMVGGGGGVDTENCFSPRHVKLESSGTSKNF